jgi:hypothetical protein
MMNCALRNGDVTPCDGDILGAVEVFYKIYRDPTVQITFAPTERAKLVGPATRTMPAN